MGASSRAAVLRESLVAKRRCFRGMVLAACQSGARSFRRSPAIRTSAACGLTIWHGTWNRSKESKLPGRSHREGLFGFYLVELHGEGFGSPVGVPLILIVGRERMAR